MNQIELSCPLRVEGRNEKIHSGASGEAQGMMHPKLSHLTLAIATALSLSACGGGGGTKSNPPPAPITTPPAPLPPPTCQDKSATNFGGALPCAFRYNTIYDNVLVPTNVDQAHAAGHTGRGVKVGLLDDAKYDYAPLIGVDIPVYVDLTGNTALSTSKPWHGVYMAAIIAGKATGDFKGGVAPDASLYWGRICDGAGCSGRMAQDAVSMFVDAGVRIFNVSNGVRDRNDGVISYNTADSSREAYEKALRAGALIVASTGNESAETAGFPAAVPKYFPEWSQQFIAVTGVDIDAKGNPKGLGKFSMSNGEEGTLNACGDAAAWCVAGVVDAFLPGHAAETGTMVTGTSITAAEVSGVAALVSGAYPWMTGANLQTTLLTTATDIGDAGVDRLYGWGLINAAKAVQGPAQFLRDFNADVTVANGGIFSNAISGPGGLVKTGDGRLTLSGQNTYGGLTSVQGGTLAVSGGIAGSVSVDKGTLASYGAKIGGDYTSTADGTTAVQIGTGMTVGGTASLDGTLRLLAPATGYAVGSTEKVIDAGKVVGTFNKVAYGNDFFWSASLGYSTTGVTAELTRNNAAASAAALALPAAVIEGAKHVDVLIKALDTQVASGSAVAQVSTSAAGLMTAGASVAASGLESLSGQVHGAAQVLAFEHADVDGHALADRLDGLHGGDNGAWIQTYGVNGTLDHPGFAPAELRVLGAMVGADARLGSHSSIGGALASSRLRGSIDALNGSTDGRANTVAVYGRTTVDEAYVSGSIGYSRLSQDVERTVTFGIGSEHLTAKVDGHAWQARLETGYTLPGDLTPFVAVDHVRLHRGSFNERSKSGMGFVADSSATRTTTGEIGLRWDAQLSRGTIGTGMAIRHRFGNRTPSFAAAFDGLHSAGFDVAGAPLSLNDARVGLQGIFQLTENAQLFGNISALWDNESGSNTGGNVGLRFGF